MKNYVEMAMDFDSMSEKMPTNDNVDLIIKKIHTISNYYIGHKERIFSDIVKILNDNNVVSNTVLDLFSGSGAVSYGFKLLNKTVISNDLLKFCHINSFVFLDKNRTELTDSDKDFLFDPSLDTNIRGIVSQFYSDKFTRNECVFLDNYFSRAMSFQDEYKRYYSIFSILQYLIRKCFVGGRLYKKQIIARMEHRIDHAMNCGHELQFHKYINWTKFSCDSNVNDISYNYDVFSCLDKLKNIDIDLCYIDPPYGGMQSDYALMYEFCEDYVRNCRTRNDMDFIKKSNMFIGNNIDVYRRNFCDMVDRMSFIPTLLFSYNSSSWAKIDDIIECIKVFRSDVKVKEITYSYGHRKSNSNKNIEYLILAR